MPPLVSLNLKSYFFFAPFFFLAAFFFFFAIMRYPPFHPEILKPSYASELSNTSTNQSKKN